MKPLDLEREIAIAPIAIPLTEEEFTQAHIDPKAIPIATSAHLATDLIFCTEENKPFSENPKVQLEIKTPELIERQQSNLVIERVVKKSHLHDTHFSSSTPLAENTLTDPNLRELDIVDPHKTNTYLSAWFFLFLIFSIIATLVSTVLLYFDREQKLYLIAPAAMLVLGCLYFLWIMNTRCCVCHQKQFTIAKNRKKQRAHYIPLLGYVFPTALHMAFRGFYRCMVCGSGISLFKNKE